MKRIIWISLCILLSLTACSALVGSPAGVAPEPAQPGIAPEEWATRYPNEYDDWEDSVHGVAYLSGNSDAPGCTDCHSDPETGDIEAPNYRLEIPSRCARCHADQQVMSEYGLAADVYDTYQADYHGTTIEYYRANDPTRWCYEAVCSDCHESHAVYRSDDPRSPAASANLLATCQRCHPEAPPDFAAASTGHYRTTREASPLVYYIKLFYTALIPVVIGLMLAYIGLDISHRLRKKSREEES